MNTVKKLQGQEQTTVGALVGSNMSNHNHTAFVGKCGCGPAHALYLITRTGIVQADKPYYVWCMCHTNVTVDHYCDVTILETGSLVTQR